MSSLLRSRTATRFLLASGGATSVLGAYRYQQVRQRERELPTETLSVFADEKNAHAKNKKPVIVIGGGVVGITTAYKLVKAGHSVAVLEPAPVAAAECSACAAGGMQRANVVVDRDSWYAILKCIVPWMAPKQNEDTSSSNKQQQHFRFFNIDWWETLSDPFFLRWVITFTKTSLFPDSHQNEKQSEMLKFTKFAVHDMVDMMENAKDNMAVKSGYNTRGGLSVSYDPPVADEKEKESTSQAKAAKDSHPSGKLNFEPSRRLQGDEIFQQEPSLLQQDHKPTAAKFEFEAKSASSQRFTVELAERCANELNVSVLYNTAVQAITTEHDTNGEKKKPRVAKLHTNRGVIVVPEDAHVVVAAGAWTPHVLALMDLYAPVYPLTGYAMSISAQQVLATSELKPSDLPSRIVSDKYMYTTRLGDEIRITSIGELSGWSTQPTPHVDAEFRREAVRQFPQLQPFIQQATTRCGHRPFVNDGLLLLGTVDTHENLYVSCGPGSNGWKLAMGSGEVIERLIGGQTPEQIQKDIGFDVNAFSPAGRVLKAPFFAKLCRARWGV